MDFFANYSLLLAIASIVGIWTGSGLIVKNATKLAKRIGISSFVLSFFLLGFLTSTSEIVIAISSLNNNEPEVSAGNLLGGIVILFFFLIPLLTILLKQTRLNHSYSKTTFLFNILLLILPSLFFLDKELSKIESIILLISSFLILIKILVDNNLKKNFEVIEKKKLKIGIQYFLLIVLGVLILVISSDFLVKETILIAHDLNVDPFLISILGLSIGTNLPEISLAIKSVLKGKKDIALGNYMGSAVFNVIILGFLGLASGSINITSDYTLSFLLTTTGFIVFWFLMLSKNRLSRREGILLLFIYIFFILLQASSIL